MKRKVRKAVIPAAGLGTRFLPATKEIPKEMIPILDKPMIQYTVEECVGSGIEEIILVLSPEKGSIKKHFEYNQSLENFLRSKNKTELLETVHTVSKMAKVRAVMQDVPHGLGHAVLMAKDVIGQEPFAVVLSDDLIVSKKTPCTRQLIDVFESKNTSVIGVMEVPRSDVSKYGIVGGPMIESKMIKVEKMIEKPKPENSPSCFACPGRYVLTPEIFSILEKTKPGSGGEIQLTDALAELAKTEGLLAYLYDGERFDTGDKVGYLRATIAFALERADLKSEMRKILKEFAAR